VSGDPSVHRLREAIAAGAIPFTCQGNENGSPSRAARRSGSRWSRSWPDRRTLTGSSCRSAGALASSVAQAFAEARALGAIDRQPRWTSSRRRCWPSGAYDRVAARLRAHPGAAENRRELHGRGARGGAEVCGRHPRSSCGLESEPRASPTESSTTRRMMAAVVRGMLTTGGTPVTVDEEPHGGERFARDTTASTRTTPEAPAGRAHGAAPRRVRGAGESVAVFLTGVTRA